MKDETPEQAAARRAADAERKRKSRAAAKEAAASQDEISTIETIQDFWAIALRGLDPALLAKWNARQDYVEALLGDIRTVLEGRAPDAEFAQDVDDEVRDDIKEHGVAGVTAPLLIGKYWQDPALLAKLTNGDSPSAIFAKFGVLTAIDDYNLHKWDTLVAAHRSSKQPRVEIPTVFYVPLKCSLCNSLPMSVPSAVADAYRRTNNYVCAACMDKASKIRNFTHEQRGAEHDLFDVWGRVKDQ